MVDKTTSFKKRAKGRRGTSKRMTRKLLLPRRSPKLDPSLELSASTAKGMVNGSGTALDTWRIYAKASYQCVGVLGTPLPPCGPRRGYASGPVRPIFINKAFKTLARGQASRGGRRKTSSGAASPGCLARSGEIKAGQTSRGSRDVSHDDQDQAGARRAPARAASLFPLWC